MRKISQFFNDVNYHEDMTRVWIVFWGTHNIFSTRMWSLFLCRSADQWYCILEMRWNFTGSFIGWAAPAPDSGTVSWTYHTANLELSKLQTHEALSYVLVCYLFVSRKYGETSQNDMFFIQKLLNLEGTGMSRKKSASCTVYMVSTSRQPPAQTWGNDRISAVRSV